MGGHQGRETGARKGEGRTLAKQKEFFSGRTGSRARNSMWSRLLSHSCRVSELEKGNPEIRDPPSHPSGEAFGSWESRS